MGERRIIDFFEKNKSKSVRAIDVFLSEIKKPGITPTEKLRLLRLIRCLLYGNS